jgi:hypothetical protein
MLIGSARVRSNLAGGPGATYNRERPDLVSEYFEAQSEFANFKQGAGAAGA